MTNITSTRCSGRAMFTISTLLQRRRIRIDGRKSQVDYYCYFFNFFLSLFHIFFYHCCGFLLVVLFLAVFVFVCFLDLGQLC